MITFKDLKPKISFEDIWKSRIILIAFLLCFIWIILLFSTFFLVEPNTIDFGEDGKVGLLDHSDTVNNVTNPVAKFVYWSGDVNCHQISSRSIFLNGNQMAYCVRDLGIFLGLTIAFFLPFFWKRVGMNIPMFIIFLIPIALDGGLQLITSYESNNLFRMITGFLCGFASGILITLFLYELRD